MSYILDALRRADAERERGAVPSLHAQQQFALGEGDGESEGRPKIVWWVAGGIAAVLIAAFAWIWLGSAPPSAAVASAPASAQPPTQTPPPAAPPAPAVAPQQPPTVPPAAVVAPAPQATPATPRSQPVTPRPTRRTAQAAKATEGDNSAPAAARTTRRAAARPETHTAGGSEARTSAPTVATNAAPRTAPSAEPAAPREASRGPVAAPETRRVAEPPRSAEPADGRVMPQRELPEDVRRSLPNYKVSGSVYSSDPTSRMLMINGQIFREGDAVATGLVLSQIRRKSAVFEFRGYRYEMAF